MVIYDVHDAGLTTEQVESVYSRINGLYNCEVPGVIELWINNGIIRK